VTRVTHRNRFATGPGSEEGHGRQIGQLSRVYAICQNWDTTQNTVITFYWSDRDAAT
jgi:hypothetical protein